MDNTATTNLQMVKGGKAHNIVPNDNKRKPSEDTNNEERKLKLAKAYEATLSAANDHAMSDRQGPTWRKTTNKVFEQLVLKVGTDMLIYIALIFSQVVYLEMLFLWCGTANCTHLVNLLDFWFFVETR
jgi:hypothetical protein